MFTIFGVTFVCILLKYTVVPVNFTAHNDCKNVASTWTADEKVFVKHVTDDKIYLLLSWPTLLKFTFSLLNFSFSFSLYLPLMLLFRLYFII